MIQATDFVCPVCRSQVGHACIDLKEVFAYGRVVARPTVQRSKPHPERRRLAKAKRALNSGGHHG